MLRIEETDEDVDLRPRRPPEAWRYEDRGVIGAGDSDDLVLGVGIRGRGYEAPDILRMGVAAGRLGEATLGVRRGSSGLLFDVGEVLRVEESLLDAGDLALFADSKNQCLIDASWLRMVC